MKTAFITFFILAVIWITFMYLLAGLLAAKLAAALTLPWGLASLLILNLSKK